ncbi:MAG: ABC transporter substrate-binding protein [Nitrospirota bacterium]|nr:ABC transporter substrate-binding protein [Nitrospirota bacterium]
MKKNKMHSSLISTGIAVLMTVLLISACKGKTYVIGFVNPNPGEKEGAQGFLNNMPKQGYVEGKNVTYIKCETQDKKIIDAAIKDMVNRKVDLIFTMTTPAARMAKKHTEGTNIPVVFVMYDAVTSEVAKSLIEPGGNLTGIQLRGSTEKSLEWLSAVVPHAKNIFVPIAFDTGAAKLSLEDLRQAAAKLNINLTISEVSTVEELHASLSSMPENTDAIFILHSWLVGSHLDSVINEAIKRKIPVISAGHVDYSEGVVMSYGPIDDFSGAQAVRLADHILRGTPPRDLPVETASFYLGINLKTAKAMGLEIPNDVLQQADFIIR